MPTFDFDFERSADYQDAVRWFDGLHDTFFRQGDNFELALEYARERWSFVSDLRKSVEDKADGLLKVLLGAAVIVATLLKSSTSSPSSWWLLPAGLAVVAMCMCLAARHTGKIPEPCSLRGLLPLHQNHPDAGIRQAQLAASYYVNTVAMKDIVNNKSSWLDTGLRFAVAAGISVVVIAVVA